MMTFLNEKWYILVKKHGGTDAVCQQNSYYWNKKIYVSCTNIPFMKFRMHTGVQLTHKDTIRTLFSEKNIDS